MADNTTTTIASLLYELQGGMQELHGQDFPFTAQLTKDGDPQKVGRYTRANDKRRETFSGSNVRFSLVPYGMKSGGWVSETGTWNVPSALTTAQATLTLNRFVQPFSLTIDAERDSMEHSDIQATKLMVDQAWKALARNEEIAFLGDGTGLLATITDSATSLTTTVTGANWDLILPGDVYDVVTRATGADPGQGLRRKVASISTTSETAGTITWSTTATASDGGSGSIVHTNADGVYLPGSYGNVCQGLAQAAAITGTFEGIDKATYEYWQGTDGRGGVTTTTALSNSMLMGAIRRGRRTVQIGAWTYAVGDPAAIDLYLQAREAQLTYTPQMTTLYGGFQGAVFTGADKPLPLLKAPYATKGTLRLVREEDLQLYGDSVGPKFLDDDGGMARRFTRALPKEFDLLDRVELGFRACSTIVFLNNLDVAAVG